MKATSRRGAIVIRIVRRKCAQFERTRLRGWLAVRVREVGERQADNTGDIPLPVTTTYLRVTNDRDALTI